MADEQPAPGDLVADVIKNAAAAAQNPPRLTVAYIKRNWPPAVPVDMAALALNIPRSTAYQWVREGKFPCPVITVRGQRVKARVPTAGLVALLEGKAA